MLIKNFIKDFKIRLKSQYPTEEISAFLYIIFDDLKKWTKTQLLINDNQSLSSDEITKLDKIIVRLQNNEPLQYILGYTEFYDMRINVAPGVLIPRQETEEFIDYNSRIYPKNSKLNILDLGTGSGCIALGLAKDFPLSKVYACDISDTALTIAKQNARQLKLNVHFFNADILNFPKQNYAEKYDLLVSNPPYVRNSEKELMNSNVLNYEPKKALFVSDKEPLIFYEAIADIGKTILKPKGRVFVEINEFLGEETKMIFKKFGYHSVEIIKDISSKDRFVNAFVG